MAINTIQIKIYKSISKLGKTTTTAQYKVRMTFISSFYRHHFQILAQYFRSSSQLEDMLVSIYLINTQKYNVSNVQEQMQPEPKTCPATKILNTWVPIEREDNAIYSNVTSGTSQVLLAGVSGVFSPGTPVFAPPTD